MKVTKREGSDNQQDYSKHIGLATWKCIALNPDLEQLKAILKTDKIEKEPVYIKDTTDGETMIQLNFWMQSAKGVVLPLRFSIIDKVKVSQSGKTQFVAQNGSTSYVDDKSNLQDWFTKFLDKSKKPIADKEYREALVGEEDLYSFLRSWIVKADWFSPDTNILLDTKKLFRGKIDDLKSFIDSDMVEDVVLMATVRVVDTDDGTKEYNQLSPKVSLPGYKMKLVRNSITTGKWDDDKALKYFKEAIVGEFGLKDLYLLKELTEYDPSTFVAAGNDTLVQGGDDLDTSY